MACAGLTLVAAAPQAALAQAPPDYGYGNNGNDPNGNSSGTNGVGNGGTGNFGDNQGSLANGQQNGSGTYYNPGGGQLQNTVPMGEFTPVPLPNYGPQTGEEQSTTRVARPTENGALPVPLYARPGSKPGQFELFSRPPPQMNEFQKFVKKTLGRELPRFGSTLILNGSKGFATSPTTTVPPDYRLNPGDELLIDVTGSVEAQIRLVIDSEGRIFVPRIGAINVAGVRYGDLANTITHRFEQQFKNVKVSVVISHLHGLTVYVTGYAVSPGAYTVSSLSTMVDAVLAAGGPSAAGSFRVVELRRGGAPISDLDLYDLLLNGDKSHDAVLQNGDVLNIEPAGPELALTGSVNLEAIFEAKPGETLGDMIRYAGGLNSLADTSRVLVARLGDLDAEGSQQLAIAQAQSFPAERGDIVRILSLADVARPQERQAILATIEGEVDHPGRYYLKPSSTMADLLAAAGGLTSGAFVYGTELDRESVKTQQQASFDRAVDDLELAAAAAPLSSLTGSADKIATGEARQQAALAIVERLRQRKPDGRLVLSIAYGANALPGYVGLENLDHLYVPPQPQTVGVFGAVFQTGSFLFNRASRIGDYLKLAGGPQKIADRGEIFVVRANGSVISSQQDHGLSRRPALPGDVIFVPVRTGPTAFQKLLDIAQVVYEFGVGALTLKALGA
ncbi:MAG TPA: SLBB domain-containing protein [Caulobacteraceae bacterium]